jgi:cytochrome P450
MQNTLVADDSLYEELYDVRREAEDSGNFVDRDMNPDMCALREQSAVHEGYLRDLLKLPPHHRHAAAAGRPGYTCFSWAACDAAFRDHKRFSSLIMQTPGAQEKRLGFLEMDEPEHLAYRSTIQPMFLKGKTLTWWRLNWINEIVETLVSNLQQSNRAELNLQLCARVPVHTITRAVGLLGDDALVFRTALIKSGAYARLPIEEVQEAGRLVDSILDNLITRRRVEPGDDIISGLIAAKLKLHGEERPLTSREVLISTKLVMLAGGGTSWRQMGITLWALLANRDQLEAVKADRQLMESAIEESVRWNPTDPVFSRLVLTETELAGFALPEGSVLEICLGAANRDPARWDNPDVYDLHRKRQNHMGFGMGPHLCLGRDVARSEINVAINALFDHFPNMRLDPDKPAPFLTGGLEQRGISGLPVLLR